MKVIILGNNLCLTHQEYLLVNLAKNQIRLDLETQGQLINFFPKYNQDLNLIFQATIKYWIWLRKLRNQKLQK